MKKSNFHTLNEGKDIILKHEESREPITINNPELKIWFDNKDKPYVFLKGLAVQIS